MYCRFPKGYFFEVEKIENLLEFEEIEDMREVDEMRDMDVEDSDTSDVFEFNSYEDDDRNKCKCNEKKEKHVEHKCDKHKDKKDSKCGCKDEAKPKCGCKEEAKVKCNKESGFFSISDEEYIEEMKIEVHDCKCNCKNK